MNLRALHYLIALSECLNFSRAAERCSVTQSTLSIQLRKLEEYLGITIFRRNRAHVMLTVEGEEVLRLARIVVSAEGEILRICRAGPHSVRRPQSIRDPHALIDEINYARTRAD
jgi:DNA-binding transcriptional LysR family regulator